MKKYIKILLIPVLLLGSGASRAMADDEALAAVGGFIGGIIATKVYDHHRDHKRHSHKEVVIVERGQPYGQGKYKSRHRCDHKARYKTVYKREWVPGYWDVYYNRCGGRVRHWVSGYHEKVAKRVRVDCGCDGRGHRSHEYSYYGHR